MSNTTKIRERSLVLVVAVLLALMTPMTYAVVKNVTVVDSGGKPLGNTKVTIVFPDGTEEEEETDDKGMLIFDFPGDGEYMIKYPGGSMPVSVSAGVPTWAWVAGGLAAAGGVAVALDDDDDDNSSGSPGSGSDPGTGGAVDPCQGDTFNFIDAANFSVTVSSNPGNHPNEFGGPWEIFCDTGMPTRILNVSSNNINVEYSCTVGTGGSCAATTDCMYAGFTTTCEINGTFGSSSLTGTMTAGGDGNLPGGQPIVVNVDATL